MTQKVGSFHVLFPNGTIPMGRAPRTHRIAPPGPSSEQDHQSLAVADNRQVAAADEERVVHVLRA